MIDVTVPSAAVLFESVRHSHAKVSVAITLHNYRQFVLQALDSVFVQELEDIDLLVVDDCSTDGGEQDVLNWLESHHERFGRTVLARHPENQGLAAGRNQGFSTASTAYVFVLDADNQLYPRCLSVCVAAAEAARADAVYTLLEVFGESEGVMGTDLWDAEALRTENYIDAMALIRRSAWQQVGGYRHMPANGWEDYDLWNKFIEAGLEAVRVPEILCRYRQRESSMLRSATNRSGNAEVLAEDMRLHHPGIRMRARD
jgi:glycosyltransferase involved in cell wall biosynthesis